MIASGISQERNTMNKLRMLVFKIWSDKRGQDLIEYALMAGFVAVAASAVLPTISNGLSTIFSKVGSIVTAAAAR